MSETNGNGKWPLPEGWVWTTLGKVANPERQRVNPQDHPGLPFIGMDDISSHTMQLIGTKPAAEMKSLAEHFRPDDVLYGSLRPYLNKVYRPDFEGLASAEFIIFRSVPHLESRYLQYFLNQWSFVEFINRQNTGDRPRVKFNQMAEYHLPLAPLPEQHRIVAEIEKQFTRLDAAVAALRRAKANLARYKAAVLKAAVEGRLVPQDPDDEPADALLECILAERRAQWEAANPKKKYVEPKRPEVDGLPELPVGWAWARFEQLLLSSQNGFGKRNSSIGEPTIVLRLADIVQGTVSVANVRRIRMSNEETEKYKLHKGDLLCLRVNGSPNLVGRMVNIRGFDEDVAFCDHFIRFQLVDLDTSPYVSIYFESETIRKFIELNMVSSAGQNTVSQRTLADVQVPLPPIAEQQRIVLEIERQFSVIQASEQVIDANLTRAERLRQGVLGKAFRGELV